MWAILRRVRTRSAVALPLGQRKGFYMRQNSIEEGTKSIYIALIFNLGVHRCPCMWFLIGGRARLGGTNATRHRHDLPPL
ncbi:hypothetical protein XP420_00270, partial [Xanthomonas perforans]